MFKISLLQEHSVAGLNSCAVRSDLKTVARSKAGLWAQLCTQKGER